MEDWSKGAAWMRGDVMPISQAAISVTDWGVTHSDIVYDVVPVWKGAFFRLNDYLDRFMRSMQAGRFDIDMDRSAIEAALHQMVAQSGLQDGYCAMVVSRGVPAIHGIRDPRACLNHFYAWCVPYVHVVKPELADQGATVWIAKEVRRIPPNSVNPRTKNYQWGDFTAGLFEAKDHDYETVVLLDQRGFVTEGPGFNVFALIDGTVVTPAEGVLEGITRLTALEMCAELGFPTEQRDLSLAELTSADEVFLSSSGGGVIPVGKVDEHTYGDGRPGPVAVQLRKLYWEWLMRPALRQDICYR